MKEIRDLYTCNLFHKENNFLRIGICSCIKMPVKGNFKRNLPNVYSCFIGCEAAKFNTLWMFLDSCLYWRTEIGSQKKKIDELTLTCCGQGAAMSPCYENSVTSSCRVVCISVALSTTQLLHSALQPGMLSSAKHLELHRFQMGLWYKATSVSFCKWLLVWRGQGSRIVVQSVVNVYRHTFPIYRLGKVVC